MFKIIILIFGINKNLRILDIQKKYSHKVYIERVAYI